MQKENQESTYLNDLVKALEKAGSKVTMYTSFTTSSCCSREVKDPKENKIKMDSEKIENIA